MRISTSNALTRAMAPDVLNLLVVSHVVHYQNNGHIAAYGPYAREIDIWADLFTKVTIAAPCGVGPPPMDCVTLTHPNVVLIPQRETGGTDFASKINQLLLLPLLVFELSRAMLPETAIHVRCPGNLGLLGIVLAPLFSRYRVAKYAGQWSGYPGEAWTVRLQRALLRSPWWGAPVTVYGKWPNQPEHIVPFFTSVLSEEQMAMARASERSLRWHTPLHVIFVGRLSRSKNVHVLLTALATLSAKGQSIHCTIIGDGPERATLQAQANAHDPKVSVDFVGATAFEQVLQHYASADVLVLASETEGWPKAIAEGMAFGLVCIGSTRGLIPQMLGEGRGILVPPGDSGALADVLGSIAMEPASYDELRHRAAAWAQQFTLEGLQSALAELLTQQWGVPIQVRPAKTEESS